MSDTFSAVACSDEFHNRFDGGDKKKRIASVEQQTAAVVR